MKKLFYIGALSALLLAACGDDVELTNINVEGEPVKVEVVEEKEITIDKKIEKAVIKAIGKKNNLDKKTVDSISYIENGKAAFISLNAGENLTTNLTKKGMWLNSKKVFEAIKDIEDVDLFLFYWYLPLVDKYGNEEKELVMAFEIAKDELQKINYDNFLTDNVPKIVGNYFEHTAFSN